MASNYISGLIGTAGQEVLGSTLANIVSKEICESIRTEFKGPFVEQFKGLLTTASAEILTSEMLKEQLTKVIESIEIEGFNITGGGSGQIHGGAGAFGLPAVPTGLPTSTAGLPTSVAGIGSASPLPNMPKLPDFSVGPELFKQFTGGLAPDAKEITGGISKGLTDIDIKGMLETGLKQLIKYLTEGAGKDELVRMFIAILKERINDSYKNGGDVFQQTIIDVINGKCSEKQAADNAVIEELEEGLDERGGELEGQDERGGGPVLGGKSKKKTRTTRKIKKH
jgi:hypothetical protein